MTGAIQTIVTMNFELQERELSVKTVQIKDEGWDMAEVHKLLNLL